jgi:hypothetical protein
VGAPKRSISSGLGDAAVLHRVVHQRGHHGLRVQPPVGHQAGHRDGVRDVGLAAGAELAQVGLVGELVGLAHLLQVGLAQVGQLVGQGREGDAFRGGGRGRRGVLRAAPAGPLGSNSAASERIPMARI